MLFRSPTSIEEALEDSDWVMAMQEELNNFTRNEVWVLEAPPKDKNIIGTKWVFRNKQDEHGVVGIRDVHDWRIDLLPWFSSQTNEGRDIHPSRKIY